MIARSVLVTGGGGFLGSRLAALAAAEAGAKVRVVDVAFPAEGDARCERITGDLTDPAVLARALTPDITEVFHLAAVVSGGAEADFDLGYRVNLDGTRALLEACRKLASRPKFVFASSVAVFGGSLPEVLDDSTTPTPQTSYGVQKLVSEHLVADYTRKGYLDGRSLRLPTIVVRPGKPNLAASSFASSIIREPLAGVNVDCPVPGTTSVWLLSPQRVIEAFVHARDLAASAWPSQRSVNLPGITLSVREMLAALERVAGKETAARVRFVDDARIQAIVKTWPTRFRTERALAMGFKADANFDDVVRAHAK